jgi:hypothetical protein
MQFDLELSLQILRRTPDVVATMLSGLSDEWTMVNEGGDTWSAYDIVGHLIHGENTDWIPRMKIILDETSSKRFEPFDHFAQFENSKGKTFDDLLEEFKVLRENNTSQLEYIRPNAEQLQKKGIHPAFGEVTLAELLAAWVVHDLAHINQLSRVMAKQYKESVGPWTAYMNILNQ